MENKINVIKEVREKANCGLKEAKEAVEAFERGEITNMNHVIQRAIKSAQNRPPRHEEIRSQINNRIKGMINLLEMIDTEFDERDIAEIKDTMNTIADDAFSIRDRMLPRYEDAVYNI